MQCVGTSKKPDLRLSDHIELLHSWALDDKIRLLVEHTCLYKFANSINNTKLKTRHLTDLCESYDQKDNSFTIGGRKFYLGLEDVFYITGLPIKGESVTVNESGSVTNFEAKFGIKNKGSVKLSELKKFINVPEDCDNLTKYAQAYLLFVIGCIMFPAMGGRLVLPCAFLHFVNDLHKVNDYAWGAAMLAYTHRGLLTLKNEKLTNTYFTGNGLLLLIFSLVHIPQLGKFYGLHFNEFPKSFPLIRGWTRAMVIPSRNTHEDMHIDEMMTIEYHPYTRIDDVPDERKEELSLCYVDVPTHCLNENWNYRCERYLCHLPSRDYSVLTPINSIPHKSRKGLSKKNWLDYHTATVGKNQRIQGWLFDKGQLSTEEGSLTLVAVVEGGEDVQVLSKKTPEEEEGEKSEKTPEAEEQESKKGPEAEEQEKEKAPEADEQEKKKAQNKKKHVQFILPAQVEEEQEAQMSDPSLKEGMGNGNNTSTFQPRRSQRMKK